MSIEQFVKFKIKERSHTIQNFAAEIGMSYSTVINALRYGLLRSQTKTTKAILDGLELNISDVLNGNFEPKQDDELVQTKAEFADFLQMQKRQIEMELERIEAAR